MTVELKHNQTVINKRVNDNALMNPTKIRDGTLIVSCNVNRLQGGGDGIEYRNTDECLRVYEPKDVRID